MPEENFETPQPNQPAGPEYLGRGQSSSGRSWPKIILAAFLGLALLAGAAYAGYWYGTESAKVRTRVSEDTGSTPMPTSTVTIKQPLDPLFEPVEDSLIAFEKEGKIFLLNGLDKQPAEVAKGNQPAFSPDRSKIAYVKAHEDSNIYIYDVKTGRTNAFSTNEWRLVGVSWSPDGEYLVTDSGGADSKIGGIYEYLTGKKVASFTANYDYRKMAWASDKELVFTELQKVSPYRPYGSGKGSGLSKITLPDGNKQQTLVQATALEDFGLIKTENGRLYFTKNVVKSSDDWSFSDRKETSYWQMNSGGDEKTEIAKPGTLEERTLGELPTEFSGYHFFSNPTPHPNSSDWVIFSIHKEGLVPDGPICIMDLNNPNDSFLQLATGTHPSW